MNNDRRDDRYYCIDCLRCFLCMTIVFFHIVHGAIQGYCSDVRIYDILYQRLDWANEGVNCFLIIGGFFLYDSYIKHHEKPFFIFFWMRFFRIWPVLAFSVVISFFFWKMKFENALFELTLLNCTGISLIYKGITWYVAPFFWSSVLLMSILRLFEKKAPLIIGILCYFGFLVNINYTNGGSGREVVFSTISLGITHCLAGLALGILINIFIKATFRYLKEITATSLYKKILIIIIECITMGLFVGRLLFGIGQWTNRFMVAILFSIVFSLFILDSYWNLGGGGKMA